MMSSLKRRSGFTLVEVTIACALTAFLAVLLSTTWALLMRPTADLIAWGQLFQEMDIAVASLARDLGGSQLDFRDISNNWPGEKRQGRLLACSGTFSDANGNHLRLCFDGGEPPDNPNNTADWETPDTVIDYYVDAGSKKLIRLNQNTGTLFTVAKNVDSMTITPSGATDLQIVLEFKGDVTATHKTLSRKCTLIVKTIP